MSVETETRHCPLGMRVITIRSININNKPIKDQQSLMGLMLCIYVPDCFLRLVKVSYLK